MSKPRVLVVDDEPAVLGLVSRALSLRGYEVQAVPNPLHALQLVHDTPCFDLMVSDVIMPEMCGPELVRRVVQICPEAAIVVMSAHIDGHVMTARLDGEALPRHAKFISKPFGLTDLYATVEKALSDARIRPGTS